MNVTLLIRRIPINEDKKKERLAALFGLEVPKEPGPPTAADEAASREAEAVLAYAESPEFFRARNCKRCDREFMVNMGSVSYCSDICREHTLADIGIVWDKTKPPEERWGLKVPLVVTPEALEIVNPLITPEILVDQTEVAQEA